MKKKLKACELEVSEYQKLMKDMLEDYDLPDDLIEHIQRIQEKIPSGSPETDKHQLGRDTIQDTINQAKTFGYRANSAHIIMMGPEEAESYIQNRMQKEVNVEGASNIIVTTENQFKRNRNNVRYLSNAAEQPVGLKSLNQFKKNGRWNLMPDDTPKDQYIVEGEYDNNSYLEEEEQEYDFEEGEGDQSYDQDDTPDYKHHKRQSRFEAAVFSDEDTSFTKQKDTNGILITNQNKYYKKSSM